MTSAAIPIPEQDRERVKAMRRAVALGRAADAQLQGYISTLLIEADVDAENAQLKITDEDVLVRLP